MRIEDAEPSSSSSSSGTDMPPASATLLRNIIATKNDTDFIAAINKGREVHAVMGKTELYKWTEVLNRCDEILEKAIEKDEHGNMKCDHDGLLKDQAVSIVRFTVLLFECTSSRRIYKSVDRIMTLLESTDMDLLGEVLRLLQVMGKRSKFLSTRIPQKEQQALAHRLTAIAQSWSGKLRAVKMAECLKRDPKIPTLFPFTYTDSKQRTIVVEQPKKNDTVGELITRTISRLSPPASADSTPSQQFSKEDQYCLLSRIRMLVAFDNWHHRFKCLIVRLLSISTLVYCRLGGTDENMVSSLLYSGFIEEIVELLKSDREAEMHPDQGLHDGIQTEALSTLCSIVTYEKEPKTTQILEALSAGSYHGFLSVMTRQIVDELKSNNLGKPGKPSVSLATSLFSFIYHLASIEPGGETLVGSGLTQTLLGVIGFHELPIECITFGTRCARIIDLFTTIDVTAFKANNGMEVCVNRVVHEINECKKEQPFMIDVSYDAPFEEAPEPRNNPVQDQANEPQDQEQGNQEEPIQEVADETVRADPIEVDEAPTSAGPTVPGTTTNPPSAISDNKIKGGPWEQAQLNGVTCHQQRSGLIKGLLTFIKRAIGDAQFQDIMKHLMEGDLPEALMHILSNAEYYSPSLFHQSAHLITNFVYQFPEELSSIQRRHVPYVIFQSLLRKELPNSKDVITTLGNVFTAMCLNERGLKQFKSYDPFDQIFRIVLSVKFLVTLRKKRSAEAFESAQAIGGALDDLMRHYPELKHDMLKSIIIILDLLDEISRNPPEGIELVPTLTKTMARSVVFSPNNGPMLPREIRVVREQRQPQQEVPEQADERVGGDVEEEAMEVEEGEDSDVDEEDNEMSMDEMSGEAPDPPVPSPKPSKPFEYGAGMMCEDSNGKKMLPIGDYMLLIARVVETMMTQSPSQEITTEFIEGRVMQKIMRLCQLPCITTETTHIAYINSIANIVKHIVKAGFQSQRNGPDAGPKLMAAIVEEFSKTVVPLFETNNGDFSSLKSSENKKATLLMHLDEKLVEKTLMELNSLIPILLNLNKAPITSGYNPTDQRNRILEAWKMPEGVKLYGMLRKLSRMLCWEYELVQTLKPTIRTAATQTEGEMLSDQPADSVLDVETMPPWEEDTVGEQQQKDQSRECRWKMAGVSQEEHDFWIKNKSLQDVLSKSHVLVKELLNSMGKQINVNSTNRRLRTRDPQQIPLAATQCISMIFTSIYKDLKWEPAEHNLANSPMAYGRYIELLTQLHHSLFENGAKSGNIVLLENFYKSGCHKAFFELFTEKIIPFLGETMPEGVEQTMEEWCRLAAKLTDYGAIVTADAAQRRDRQDFEPIKYLKLVCHDMFNVYKQFFEKMTQMPDWELKSLKKVCENAFSVFKEVAKNLVEETENSPSPPVGGNANPPADAPPDEWAPGIPRPAQPPAEAPAAQPQADGQEEAVAMLMDLGFSRDIVLFALETTRSVDEAANYLLAHGNDIRLHEPFRDEDIRDVLLRNAGADGLVDHVAPNIDEVEIQLNASFVDLQGYALVRAADHILRSAGAEQVAEQIQDMYPQDRQEINAQTLINDVMDRLRNFRTSYEEDIVLPLIPPLSHLKIEQNVSLNSACNQLFPLVKRLLLVSNDSIHPCAELIVSIFPAMTEEWRTQNLISEICGNDLLTMANQLIEQELDESGRPKKHEVARTMANRLHFAVLVFDKVSEEYVQWIDTHGMTEVMLKALEYLVDKFKSVDYFQSLVTRVICWFDFYAKAQRLILRRKYLASLSPTLEWSYQAVEEESIRRRGTEHHGERKWIPYDAAAQKVLNNAFYAGSRSTKCLIKRGSRPSKKVDVDFIVMKQTEGSNRENVKAELPSTAQMSIPDLMASEARLTWSEEHNDRLLALSTRILQFGALDPKCSHSMLSFISRQTKILGNAVKFLEQDGMEAILRLQARCTTTYPYLVSVIVRNCIDDDILLSHVYEKTIRTYIAIPHHPLSDYSTPKAKDFSDTLNFLSPLSSRNPLVFTEAINKVARMNGSEIVPLAKEKKPTSSVSSTADVSMSSNAGASTSSAPPVTMATTSSSSHTVIENNSRAEKIIRMMITEVLRGEFSGNGTKRMLSQEKILLILSEIIKSYPSLAIIIAETQADNGSVLYSLIDTYISSPLEPLEAKNALKTLIAVISSSQSSTKAQELLVLDIKAALSAYSEKASELRIQITNLKMDKESEEREKSMFHLNDEESIVLQKISELCTIITIMCQNCPAHHHHSHHPERRERHTQNAVMKLFHKKKMCADLVKTVHCLQLSSKDSLETVNQILKTLDTLLEGSSPTVTTASLSISAPRSLMELMASGRPPRERREMAAGGIMNEHELDLIHREMALDGEMQNLLRRLQGDPFRGGAGPRPVGGQPAGDEEEEGSETDERDRSDSPSDASEQAGNEEVRDDAVETGDGEVEMADVQEGNHPGQVIAVEMDGPQAEEENGEDEEDEEEDEVDNNAQDAEEGERDREEEEDDDDDDDVDEEEDEGDDQDDDAMRVVEPNPEPSIVRRIYAEDEDDEEDEDGDEDGDSMEDDVARIDLDDDYFDIGGPFDPHRMDEVIFPPSFGRPAATAFADMFRDDFDFLPPYRIERRHVGRGPHVAGVINEHPLLTRPPVEAEVSRRPTSAFRAEILSMHTRTTLHRQNAIRRTTTEAREIEAFARGGIRMGEIPSGRMLVRGTTAHGEGMHTSFFDHIFDLRPPNIAFSRGGHYRSYNSADREDRRDVRASQVPTCLERLDSYVQATEPISLRFVSVIVNSNLLALHAAREALLKKEAEAKAKAKKEAEAAKKAAEDRKKASQPPATETAPPAASAPAPEEIGLATPAATSTTNTVSESQAPNAAARGEDTSTTPAGSGVEAQQHQEQVAQEEPMEMGDDDVPQDTLPQSSAATAASSVAGTEEIEAVERQAVEEQVPEIQDIDNRPVDAPPADAPVPEENIMAEEFRAILGDIDIPDGVDPAFLAALPEDMRAEVIRDYQRQQRAERASRPVPAAQSAAPAPSGIVPEGAGGQGGGEAAEIVPGAPLVEPIDPVFLNALPPELQEEVLAEHERRTREAEEQLRRQNAPPAPVVEMDGAAVIASLPANERAQVLAEMDDAELAGLPADMQNEARRARAQHIEPNMLRYHRLLFRGGGPGGVPQVGIARTRTTGARAAANAGPTIGQHAGHAMQAPSDQPHLIDRESILTLCLLYLVDNNRVPHARLQKVLRSACVNQTTCDFIVWCLLALLDKASDPNSDDEEIVSNVPAWLDSISVPGVGNNEKAIRISDNAQKVSIHSMLAVPMCKNILELLASIARSYPGNFLPAVLRHAAKPTDTVKQAPSFQQFWNMVQNTTKAPKTKDWVASPEQQLEECALGQLLNSLKKPNMAKSPLKEKVLKVASQIMVTLPMDTLKLIGTDETKKPLAEKLEYVIRVMTTGSCSAEGLADGLTILSEAMRSLSETTSVDIYEHLFSAVNHLGGQLLPQIDRLIVELDEAQKTEDLSDVTDQPSTSSKTAQLVVDTSAGGRIAAGRFDGERVVIDGDQNMRLQMSSCKELQLPAVTQLTDKGGAQYAILSALQTLVKVRNHMKAIRKDKAKRAKEAESKLKEKEKEKESSTASSAPASDAPNTAQAPAATGQAEGTSAAAASTSNPPPQGTEVDEIADEEPRISERLISLEKLWNSLSECLLRLGKASDPHAVLALQPAAEAFFLVHASQPQKKKSKEAEAKRKESQAASSSTAPSAVASSLSHDGLREDLDPDTVKLIEFAEKHRQVLNQALRQNNAVLSAGGPFAILTQFPKLLDFDVKRKYFRKELTKLEPSMPRYRRNDVSVQVSRNRVFSDSFRELFRLRPSEWKNRFYIIFQGEEGQDAGGLLREWFSVITREIFNPNYALFITAPGDMVTYMINKASYINPEHLDYFKFVGRLIAKSVFEHKYLDCYFTRAFYKHILNLPVRYQDLESEDPAFFKSLDFLLQNPIDDLGLDLTFSTEVEEFGVRSVRDLKPNGRKIEVNDANKDEYVKLVCQMKMTGSIRKQLDAFLTGFYEIIPKDLISMFNEQELELLISGLPTVDIDDMAANTEYKGFQKTSTHIQWFWRALRSFEKEDKAKFLQFVTGTSKVPLQGFASLEGMNGVQKFSIHMDSRGGDRLPAAHTCFNQLDLPQYDSYEKLRHSLLLAIRECTEGFGFA